MAGGAGTEKHGGYRCTLVQHAPGPWWGGGEPFVVPVLSMLQTPCSPGLAWPWAHWCLLSLWHWIKVNFSRGLSLAPLLPTTCRWGWSPSVAPLPSSCSLPGLGPEGVVSTGPRGSPACCNLMKTPGTEKWLGPQLCIVGLGLANSRYTGPRKRQATHLHPLGALGNTDSH